MGGSLPAQMIAPLKTKLDGVEISETQDNRMKHFSLAGRSLEREIFYSVARMPSE